MSDSTSTKSNQLLTGLFVILVYVTVALAIFHPPEKVVNDRANGGDW